MSKRISFPATILIANEREWVEAQSFLIKEAKCRWAGYDDYIRYEPTITHINVDFLRIMRFARYGNFKKFPILPFADLMPWRKYKDV